MFTFFFNTLADSLNVLGTDTLSDVKFPKSDIFELKKWRRSWALIALKIRAIDSLGAGESQPWCDFFLAQKTRDLRAAQSQVISAIFVMAEHQVQDDHAFIVHHLTTPAAASTGCARLI